MKNKFALFAWYSFYPEGGFNDFVDVFETKEAAVLIAEVYPNLDWYQVVDLETQTRVAYGPILWNPLTKDK